MHTRSSLYVLTLLIFLAVMLACLPPLIGIATAAEPGDGSSIVIDDASLESTVSGMTIVFAQEYGKTTIFLRVCSNAPYFQLRSESVGKWVSELFHRTEVANGCSPSTTSYWRMVYNGDPNTGETFRIYATANDTYLSEQEFMARAARTDCRITGYGTGVCTPVTPAPVAVPRMYIDSPAAGQTVQGSIQVRGWAVDAGSLRGSGVTDVRVHLNGTLLGTANYGGSRTDVGRYFGDSRFNNSGFTFHVNTAQFANGNATLKIDYRRTLDGVWTSAERGIVINNPATPTPTRPLPTHTPTRVTDPVVPTGTPVPVSPTRTPTRVPPTATPRPPTRTPTRVPPTATPRPRIDKTLNVRYVDQVYVQQYLEGGYWNHCGPASAAMILHYAKKELRDVLYNRQATLDLVCATKPTCYGASSPAMILTLFRQRGLQADIVWNTTFDQIKNTINTGHPVLISINGANHIAVVTGYRADGTILIHDPFGGKHWWLGNINARNDYINGRYIQAPRAPQLKGVNVPYQFGRELTAFYTIPIRGPAPQAQRQATMVDRVTGGTLNTERAILRFSGRSAVATSANSSETITVGYTSQFAPSYPADQYAAAITSFVVDATDANNQSITVYEEPFEMTITLDADIIDNWEIRTGETTSSELASADWIEAPASLSQDDVSRIDPSRLVIAAWDADNQQWVSLDTTVALDDYQVTASYNRFTEFAVMVSSKYTVALPLIMR